MLATKGQTVLLDSGDWLPVKSSGSRIVIKGTNKKQRKKNNSLLSTRVLRTVSGGSEDILLECWRRLMSIPAVSMECYHTDVKIRYPVADSETRELLAQLVKITKKNNCASSGSCQPDVLTQ